jgi:glycerol-3-phosphate cytidylyltransferase
LLKRLSELGDRLVVGCSTDSFNELKGKKTVISYDSRIEVLKSCKYVSDVFPENNWEQKRSDILKYKADIFAMGDDWVGKFDDLIDIVKVVYLPRTEDISTTDIKLMVSSLNREKIDLVKRSAERLLESLSKF